MSVCLSVCLLVYLLLSLSFCLSFYQTVCPSIHPSIHVSVQLASVRLFNRLPYLSICFSVIPFSILLSVLLSFHLSVHPSVFLFVRSSIRCPSVRLSAPSRSIVLQSPWHCAKAGNPYWSGRLSTVDLLVLTNLDQLLLILQTLFNFYTTTHLNEEVNRTEFFLSVSVPWPMTVWSLMRKN